MKRAMLMAAGVTLLAACASGPNLPPKAGPEEVEMYAFNQTPPPGYQVIGTIEGHLHPGATRADLLMELRREAAKLGADAVIVLGIQERRESTSGGDEMAVARGRAIYWPREEAQDTAAQPPTG